jgi:hypothetical protein
MNPAVNWLLSLIALPFLLATAELRRTGTPQPKGNDIASIAGRPPSLPAPVCADLDGIAHTVSSVQKVLYLLRHDIGTGWPETAVLSL